MNKSTKHLIGCMCVPFVAAMTAHSKLQVFLITVGLLGAILLIERNPEDL